MSWSESVYLDAVSADGTTGFVTRLARHVDDGTTWLWVHGFDAAGPTVAFVRDDLPCHGGPTVDDGTAVVYAVEADGVTARFERVGPKDAPTGATVHVRLVTPSLVTLEATFAPGGVAGSNLPGRTEALGLVDATLATPHGTRVLRARGQLHEQHQDTPRFTVPFTYGTVRGDDLGFVFLIGPLRSGGFVRRGASIERATSAVIDPVGDHRTLRLELEHGDTFSVELERTRHYVLPISGRDRESSFVHAIVAGTDLSGCVNDWRP
jgi:hypothetical protein